MLRGGTVVVIQCRDTGGYCNWEGRAESEQELLEKAFQHAKEAHRITRTPEAEEDARKKIRLA
jgi:predicted small metal-binding protein